MIEFQAQAQAQALKLSYTSLSDRWPTAAGAGGLLRQNVMPVKGVDQAKGNGDHLACPLLFFYRLTSFTCRLFIFKRPSRSLFSWPNRDGCIIVPKTERSPKGRNPGYPSIQIVFNLDLPLAEFIKKELGHGSIQILKKSKGCLLVNNSKEGVLAVVNLINGKMRTPKIEALHRLTLRLPKSKSSQ